MNINAQIVTVLVIGMCAVTSIIGMIIAPANNSLSLAAGTCVGGLVGYLRGKSEDTK